jgi:histidinol-phosphate aminotransferase
MQPKNAVANKTVFKSRAEGRLAHIRLDYNENLAGPGPHVMQAIQKMIAAEYSTYPEYQLFHQKLARFLDVAPDEVLATNGSDEALRLILETYIEKGDEVLLLEPTFEMFRIHAESVEATIRTLSYEENYAFPLRQLSEALESGPKVVVIANPNNPTGTWIDPEHLADLFKKAPKTLFLIDEAYVLFAPKSALALFRKHPNAVIVQTFSKGFGLAGLRIGYVVADKKVIDQLKKVQLPISVNAMALIAAEAAMRDPRHALSYAKEIMRNREKIKGALEGLGLTVYPSAANFFLINCGSHYEKIKEKLKKAHILVRDRGEEPALKNCLRIAVCPTDHLEYFLKIMQEGVC